MRTSMSPRPRGFTLMEMLVTVVIISILASLAIPSYREYVMRTNRTVAKVALQDLLARQESYAVDHKGYAFNFAQLGITGTAANSIAYVNRDGTLSRNPAGALYQLSISLNDTGPGISTATCAGLTTADSADDVRLGLRLSATPIANTTDTRCGTLCVSSRGERGAANSATATDCWTR